jgi:hypothetical protein
MSCRPHLCVTTSSASLVTSIRLLALPQMFAIYEHPV